MRTKLLLYIITISALLLFGTCGRDRETHRYETIADAMRARQKAYVDFKRFKEGRPCSEVRFMCLPESQDQSWQSVPTQDHIEDLALTPAVEAKYKKIVVQWQKDYDAYHAKPHPKGEKEPMLITSLDKDFFEKVNERRFLEEMEQDLANEFPGFWKDVPKKVRYRWIRRAMSKAKKYGYNGGGQNMRATTQIIELCARIGLDFDRDPKWEAITQFISKSDGPSLSYALMACDYIDFTVFNKNTNMDGYPINDWSLRTALSYLPEPKRPIPKLHENRR